VRFAFIAAEKARYPIAVLCRCLQVARSGYYAWHRRAPSPRRRHDTVLTQHLQRLHAAHRGIYGRPRLHRALRAAGIRISPKRVARLMRAAGLTARGRRRFRATTDSTHAWPLAPNTLARRFATGGPHQVWAADITALWTGAGWCYLAVVLDLGSRRVVGWAVRRSLETELVRAAAHVALATRPAPQLHHSDRGSQYASRDYRELLATRGIAVSMSRTGNCWDNAAVESFFAAVKAELAAETRWATPHEAEAAVADYFRFYNHIRLHSALGFRSPAAYEAALAV
jgi:transposase InsO family protein